VSKDTPGYDRSAKERGLYAGHGDDPTLASYLSSLLYALSVPAFVLLSYLGHWRGLYAETAVLPVFAALLVGALAIAVVAMSRR
jgi:hypothetical protein